LAENEASVEKNAPKAGPGLQLAPIRGLARPFAYFLAAVIVAVMLFLYSALIFDVIFNNILGAPSLENFVPVALNAVFLIIGTWIFLLITKFFIAKHLENRGKKKEIKLILSLYTYVVWTLLIILIASSVFKDFGIFVASLGIIGFGLTLALQKPILNLVGWITVVLNKPFNVGDRIEVSNHRGDVIAINSMYTSMQGTRLNSQEKSEKIITFPNEFILTNPVVNYTKRVELFWEDLTILITYESNWRKAEKILFEITLNVVKKYVTLPVISMKKDKKSFEDALKLLEEASKKLSKGMMKQTIKENIETMKTIEHQNKEDLPDPSVRLQLLDSGIGLNVLFVADIRRITVMRSEIARGFLQELEKHKDIRIAYPHTQIVYDPKNRDMPNSSKMSDFV